jgi:hypothetical protein
MDNTNREQLSNGLYDPDPAFIEYDCKTNQITVVTEANLQHAGKKMERVQSSAHLKTSVEAELVHTLNFVIKLLEEGHLDAEFILSECDNVYGMVGKEIQTALLDKIKNPEGKFSELLILTKAQQDQLGVKKKDLPEYQKVIPGTCRVLSVQSEYPLNAWKFFARVHDSIELDDPVECECGPCDIRWKAAQRKKKPAKKLKHGEVVDVTKI